MSLILEIPRGCEAARRYVADTVLREFLGLDVTVVTGNGLDWRLLDNEGRASLSMPDSFLSRAQSAWLKPESLPELPLPLWDAKQDLPEAVSLDLPLPVLAGEGKRGWWRDEEQAARLGLDVLGSAFFFLSRYEEIAQSHRDSHDRFPAFASLAYRCGFLERPLLDEYVEVFWAALQRKWPALRRRPRQGELRYTCDVDHPYEDSSKRLSLLFRALAGDLLWRRRPQEIVARLGRLQRAKRGDYSCDPSNTFDWLMKLCAAYDRQATFYFIAGHSGGSIDGCYDVREPYITSLLRRIYLNGHKIGLHGSYNTFRDAAALGSERRALEAACRTAGCAQEVTRIRQHYLRWDSARTPAVMEESGLASDSSGSFADHAGFRYGTSHSFPLWDWQQERPLQVREQPLIVMEWSVIGPRYMALGRSPKALKKMEELEARCLHFGGDFTLLWHNNFLTTEWDRRALSYLLSRDRREVPEPVAAAEE